jgi:hypothetical protein
MDAYGRLARAMMAARVSADVAGASSSGVMLVSDMLTTLPRRVAVGCAIILRRPCRITQRASGCYMKQLRHCYEAIETLIEGLIGG